VRARQVLALARVVPVVPGILAGQRAELEEDSLLAAAERAQTELLRAA
jgi:hypothetical protein